MSYYSPYELIKISATQTANNSASISFTSGITSNFSSYYVKIRNYIPATDNTQLRLTFSTDGGSSYLSANYNYNYILTQSGGIENNGGASVGFIRIGHDDSNNSARGRPLDVTLYNLSNGSLIKNVYYFSTYRSAFGNNYTMRGYGMNTGTTAINAIKFASSSGNISAGDFTLYEIKEN